MKDRSRVSIGSALVLGFCTGVPACARAPSEAPEKPAPTVTGSYPLSREVTDYQDYTGRTAAVNSVQVQARVTSFLDRIYFKEGAEVTEGTLLYEIDPRSYQASYDAARGQVALNVASLDPLGPSPSPKPPNSALPLAQAPVRWRSAAGACILSSRPSHPVNSTSPSLSLLCQAK